MRYDSTGPSTEGRIQCNGLLSGGTVSVSTMILESIHDDLGRKHADVPSFFVLFGFPDVL